MARPKYVPFTSLVGPGQLLGLSVPEQGRPAEHRPQYPECAPCIIPKGPGSFAEQKKIEPFLGPGLATFTAKFGHFGGPKGTI